MMMISDYLSQFSLSLTQQQHDKLWGHIHLLQEWNKSINMTAVSKDEMLEKHILDSLSIASFFSSYKHVADIGTGGGFPGIPLSIVYPDNQYVLMDANSKKCGFLRHVVYSLDIKNVEIVHSRIEKFSYCDGFDAIVCRALSSPQKVYNLSSHLVKKNGKIFVMVASNYEKSWQVDDALPKKDDWVAHTLVPIAKLGKRYLLEYSQL